MSRQERPLFLNIPLYKVLLALTIIYFLIFGILMVHVGGQPDQGTHNYYSMRFSETWGIPSENPTSPHLITGQPYLYYWINGAVFRIIRFLLPNSISINTTLLWRLVSVSLSGLTVYYMYKLSSKVIDNKYAGVIAAFCLSNILMFVFVSGGINYDNLMNLASMAAIYHLSAIYKKDDFIKHTAWMGVWLCIAALSKEQSLLIVALLFVAWLFFIFRNYKHVKLNFDPDHILPLIFLLFAIGLFVGLYGVNLIKYRLPTPYCGQIKSSEVCQGFSERFEYYDPINFVYMWFFRDNFANNPILYFSTFWIFRMLQSIWGILSTNTFIPRWSTALHGFMLFWATLCFVRYWKKEQILSSVLVLIMLLYTGYILHMNYQGDMNFQFQHYAIQGRYLFPILGILISIMIKYFLRIQSLLLRRATLSLLIILYFTGGFGMFISRYAEVFVHWRIFF